MKAPKACGIYAIVHLKSGKRYIGSSKNMQKRWSAHRCLLRNNEHTCRHLQHAWNKYGEEAFDFEVLELCLDTPETKVVRERRWMLKFKEKLYNSSTEPIPVTGRPMLPHVKEKLLAAIQGNKNRLGKHYSGLLTDADVREIFSRYANGETTIALAQRFDCAKGTIWNVLKRETWWSVEIPTEVIAKCNVRRKQKARGEKNAHAKLTVEIVRQIKFRLTNRESQSSIARDLGVHHSSIHGIAKGRTYSYIPWPVHPVALNALKSSGPLPQSQTDPSAA